MSGIRASVNVGTAKFKKPSILEWSLPHFANDIKGISILESPLVVFFHSFVCVGLEVKDDWIVLKIGIDSHRQFRGRIRVDAFYGDTIPFQFEMTSNFCVARWIPLLHLLQRKSEQGLVLQYTILLDMKDDPTWIMTTDLRRMYQEELDSDYKIKVSGEEIYVHKNILKARLSQFPIRAEGFTELNDFEKETVNEFLLFTYTHIVEYLDYRNVCELYRLAAHFENAELKKMCIAVFGSNVGNITPICRTFAIEHWNCFMELVNGGMFTSKRLPSLGILSLVAPNTPLLDL